MKNKSISIWAYICAHILIYDQNMRKAKSVSGQNLKSQIYNTYTNTHTPKHIQKQQQQNKHEH